MARNTIRLVRSGIGASVVVLCTALAWLWVSRSRASELVALRDRAEFSPVGTNEEAQKRDVSFRIMLSSEKVRYKREIFTALSSLEEAMTEEVRKNRLTAEEISRAPVYVGVLDPSVPYGQVSKVLSLCARLGLKTIAVVGGNEKRFPVPTVAPISLPVVPHGVPVDLDAGRPANWIVVDVKRNGEVRVNGVGPIATEYDTMRPSALERRIVEAAAPFRDEDDVEVPVLIRADEQTPMAFVRRVILLCSRNHLWDFYYLSVLPDGRTCLVSRVDEPCPDGFWWGDDCVEDCRLEPPTPPDMHAARVGGTVWSYVLEEDGSARIWGGRNPDNWSADLCAVTPRPAGEVVIPESLDGHPVSVLGRSAFDSCDLTSVRLPAGIKAIEGRAFSNCRKLASISLPDSLRRLGDGAFFGTGLTRLRIPAGISYMDHWTWAGLQHLEAFEVDSGNPEFSAVAGVLYNKDCSKVLKVPEALVSVTLEPTVRELAEFSFERSSITNIELPAGLRRLEEGAFESCHDLASISIPDGVEELPCGGFAYCYALRKVRLPETLEQIGSHAFTGCASLTEIALPGSCRHINYMAFSGCENLKDVRLPDGKLFLAWNCFEGVHSACVLSRGPFLRFSLGLGCNVPSPLGWTLGAGALVVLVAGLGFTVRCLRR